MRPAAQLRSVAITGPQPMVYGRAPLVRTWSPCRFGSRLVRELPALRYRFHRSCRRPLALHRATNVAQRGRDDIERLSASSVIAQSPEAARKARQPLKWETTVPDENDRMISSSVIADDLFALRFDDDTESYFLVEIDRGQMPVRRYENREEIVGGKRRLRTHYMHKLAIYWHGWRQGRHVQQFGVEQLRVLTITTSQKRIETMLDALHEVTGGKGSELFLFIEDDVLRETNPLDAMWITGKGRECRIRD